MGKFIKGKEYPFIQHCLSCDVDTVDGHCKSCDKTDDIAMRLLGRRSEMPDDIQVGTTVMVRLWFPDDIYRNIPMTIEEEHIYLAEDDLGYGFYMAEGWHPIRKCVFMLFISAYEIVEILDNVVFHTVSEKREEVNNA
tara:strand:+ start:329 stop:742 length:414 start_codon:yes stop_codon:yes gene_type:complete